MAKMINDAQRCKIFALARGLGMSTHSREKDDDLHLLIDGLVAKPSITLLTFDDADKVIAELQHRQRFGVPAVPAAPPSNKFVFEEMPGGLSYNQYRKIVALMCELRKFDDPPSTATIEQRVAGIIQKKLHISASPDDPYRWLKCHSGIKLIRIIDGMLDTARRQAQARSGVG